MKTFIVKVADTVPEDKLREALYHGIPSSYEIEPAREDEEGRMTQAQRDKLWDLCGRYNVPFREDDYHPATFSKDSPVMYEGWVGGYQEVEHPTTKQPTPKTIYVGVEPNGRSHS